MAGSFWPERAKTMYLSKMIQSTINGDASWTKYEMQPIDSLSMPVEEGHADFISLQIDADNQSEFVPMTSNSGDTQPLYDGDKPSRQDKLALAEKEAYEKGFAQGEKDGLELGEAKADKLIRNLEDLLHEISQLKTTIGKQYEREILELVYAIAKNIIHTQLNFSETAVKDTILSALKLTAEKQTITLKVNPEDFDYVEKIRPDLFSRLPNIKSLIVAPDPSVGRGGCLMETPSGDVDARIETQLNSIHQTLNEAYLG
jgi:flagellar assembly protein FliH